MLSIGYGMHILFEGNDCNEKYDRIGCQNSFVPFADYFYYYFV